MRKLKNVLIGIIIFTFAFGFIGNMTDVSAKSSTTKIIADLKKQVIDLKKTIQKKDKEIISLKSQVKIKDKKINSQATSLKSKDKEINKLKIEVKKLKDQLKNNTPTAPSTGELGKSRDKAAKINQTVNVKNRDTLDGNQNFELTLTEVVAGQQAWDMIKAANSFNDAPDPGMKYVLAKFKVKVLSLEKEPMEINNAYFKAVSKNGVMYDDFFSIVAPKPDIRTKLYRGSEFEGWTYFMVNENDSPKVVYNNGFKSETWFDLGL